MASRLVTVFGGSGFIGRYVVQRLAQDGWQVRVAVRKPSQAQFLKPLGDVGQITPIRAPIQDDAAVSAAVQGSDAVINLCGLLYERGKQSFEAVHYSGAQRIAKAAADAGARAMIQISAIGANPRARADYARSKGAGEEVVRAAFPDAVILRPSVVFGPEDGFFNRFAAIARLSPFLPLIGGGETRFQPVYVADVADAVMAVLKTPAAAGQTYELGGPEVYSFKALMELLLKQIRRKRMLLSIPFEFTGPGAWMAEFLPEPPLTRDQVELLKHDNVVSEDALTFDDLGIHPTALEVIVPLYLDRFRVGGRYAEQKLA